MKPVRGLGNAVQALLGVHLAIGIAGLALGGRAVGVVGRLQDGPVPAGEVEPLIDGSVAHLLLNVVAMVLTAVVFGAWLGRVHGRITAQPGVSVPHSLGQARWGWLLPFYNVFVWPRITLDLWTARRGGTGAIPRPWFGVVWWATFATSAVLGRVTSALARADAPAGDLLLAFRVGAVADVLRVVAAIAGIALVAGLTDRAEAVDVAAPLPPEPSVLPPPAWATGR